METLKIHFGKIKKDKTFEYVSYQGIINKKIQLMYCPCSEVTNMQFGALGKLSKTIYTFENHNAKKQIKRKFEIKELKHLFPGRNVLEKEVIFIVKKDYCFSIAELTIK